MQIFNVPTFFRQRIWVQIKPWVYPNGKINRMALDSFLLRIVAFVAKRPGCSLEQVQNKFVPALQPHNVRELIEVSRVSHGDGVSSFSEVIHFRLVADISASEVRQTVRVV